MTRITTMFHIFTLRARHHIYQTGTNKERNKRKNIRRLSVCVYTEVLRAASSLCVRLAHVNTSFATVAVRITARSLTHTRVQR